MNKVDLERHLNAPELADLEDALNQLYQLAQPGQTNWNMGSKVATSHDGQPSTETADASTLRARRALERFRNRVRFLNHEIRQFVAEDPGDPNLKALRQYERARWHCSNCQKGNRRGARFCDRCGAAILGPSESQ